MTSTSKHIIDYIIYFWPFRKTKQGLIIILIPIVVLWVMYVFPTYQNQTNHQLFYVLSFVIFIFIIALLIFWCFHSGRIIFPKSKYTVIFCLKAQDSKSTKHIQHSLSLLTTELDKLGLLEKFRLKTIGQDIIENKKEAHNYREKYDVDLIIWGEVFSGTREKEEVYDFNKLFFTYKVPGSVIKANLSQLFKTDINIALVNRDWNIYEINSLPDTEKISGHLFEVVMFVVGIIYSQYKEFAEDSIVILENLFKLLDVKTTGEQVEINPMEKFLQVTPPMLRKGRVLAILLNVYKNLGGYFVESADYNKGRFYLEKFRNYERKDTSVLSNLAYCAFHLDDLSAAKAYTEEINKIDKNNEIYILNRAFLGILEKNYASALYFYKEIVKRRKVTGDIVIKVIAFLDERKSENQMELAYDFAIGLLNYYYCQENIGYHELRQFIKKAKKRPEYREMMRFVEEDIFNKKRNKKHKHN